MKTKGDFHFQLNIIQLQRKIHEPNSGNVVVVMIVMMVVVRANDFLK